MLLQQLLPLQKSDYLENKEHLLWLVERASETAPAWSFITIISTLFCATTWVSWISSNIHDRFFCCYKLSEHLFISYYPTIHTYYHHLLSNKSLPSPVLVHVHYFAFECFDSWDSRSLWFAVWSSANQDKIKCFSFLMIFVILTDVYIPPDY